MLFKKMNKKGALDPTWLVNIIVGAIAGLAIGILYTKIIEPKNSAVIIILIIAVCTLLSAFVTKWVERKGYRLR